MKLFREDGLEPPFCRISAGREGDRAEWISLRSCLKEGQCEVERGFLDPDMYPGLDQGPGCGLSRRQDKCRAYNPWDAALIPTRLRGLMQIVFPAG